MSSRSTPASPAPNVTPLESVPVPDRDPALVTVRLDAEHASFPPDFSAEHSVLLLAKVIAAINRQDLDAFFAHFSARPPGLQAFPYPPGVSIQVVDNTPPEFATGTLPDDDDVAEVLRARFVDHDRLQLLDVALQSFAAQEWIGMFGNVAHQADDVEPRLGGFVAAVTTVPSSPVMFALRIVGRQGLGATQFLELPQIEVELPDSLVEPDAT